MLPQDMTVVMPAYNTAGYIGEAIQSAIDQKMPGWKINIAIDADSDFETENIARKFEQNNKNIKVTRLITEHGSTAALHWLINHVETDIVVTLDSDDAFLPNASQIIINNMDSETTYLWTDMGLYNNVRDIPRKNYSLPPNLTPSEALAMGWWGIWHTRAFRMSAWNQSSWKWNNDWENGSDYQISWRLAFSPGKWKHVPINTYRYRLNRPGCESLKGRQGEYSKQWKLAHEMKEVGIRQLMNMAKTDEECLKFAQMLKLPIKMIW